MLTPVAQRTKIFYQGPANNINQDFDQTCVGYPLGEKIPRDWKEEEDAKIDVSLSGQKNIGHERMLFNRDGTLRFGRQDGKDLIEFLKTL